MQWPNITNEPINEFYATDGIATQLFPTLLPFGTGDPTCSNHCHPVSLTEAFKHPIKYTLRVICIGCHGYFGLHYCMHYITAICNLEEIL